MGRDPPSGKRKKKKKEERRKKKKKKKRENKQFTVGPHFQRAQGCNTPSGKPLTLINSIPMGICYFLDLAMF